MMQSGTVVNGMIVLDGPTKLPEGSRVDVLLSVDGDDIGAPPDKLTRDEHLAGLRRGLEDIKAGRLQPFKDAMEDIRRQFDLPVLPPG